MSIYDFTVRNMDGSEKKLSDFEGKVLLIVNTATICGFTPQYGDLQKMYKRLAPKGFEILDFPCNQFGSQAPGEIDEIHEFCTGRFGVTFPQFAKVEVNGENTEPLFKYLKNAKGFAGFDKQHQLTPILEKKLGEANPDYASKSDIKWNFTKFLVDREGNVVARFEPTHDVADIEKQVEALL